MKKITQFLFLFLFFTSYLHSQSEHINHLAKKTPNEIQKIEFKYKRVQIDKSIPNVMHKLEEAGVDLGCGVYHTEKYIQIELSDYELKMIAEQGVNFKVLIDDVTKFYAERAKKDMPLAQSNLLAEKRRAATAKSSSVKSVVIGNIGQRDDSAEISWVTPTNFTIPSTFGGCLTYTGMAAELDKMRIAYPNLISVKANASPTNQTTTEGRPVYYVKISDNPDSNETEPQVLYTGMTHSREVSSLMNQIYFMWYVLENYSTDPFIKNLVDNTEMLFIPVVNPDGLTRNETIAPTGGGMQRKNRRATSGGCTTYLEGVDINRNFGYYYGLTGSSSTICNDTYRGTAAFSEPETQIIRDFVLSKNIKTALNHHAYSNLVPHPVNGASASTGRENEFAKFCHDMTQYNRYVYGPAPGILYAASGDASDWMCGGAADGTGATGSGKNILSASPESGSLAEGGTNGGFWPTPANITIIAKRAMRMNFINAYYAGKYAKFHDLTQSNITALSSNLTFGIERLGQTTGDYTLTVTPVSSNIVSITSPATLTGMTILEQRNITAALVLSSSIKANEKIEYKISLSNGDFVLYEANYVKLYNPTVLFNNTDTDLLTKWTTTGTIAWVNSASAFSGTNSITDAATVAYPNGLDASTTAKTKILTTTASSNLAGAQKVLVQFYAKWDIERNFDLVQIQGSANGTTGWTTLAGNYTKPTSTTATNPHATKASTNNYQNTAGGGGVVYDGNTMGKWVMEEIVIDANNNSFLVGATAAKFRFRLLSDSSNTTDGYNTTFDGFYFDDFKVIKQISEPPVANCKNATLSLSSSGTLTVLPADVNNGSTDDIAITSLSVSPDTFNCTHVNTVQAVTLTVTDADGQTSTCVSNVTIKDVTPPVTPTLTNITAQCSSTPTAPTTTDVCAGTITGTTSTTFPITTQGTTVVTWTFNDGNGQSITSDQNVIIDDTVAPLTPALADLTGQCEVTPAAPTTTDACAGTITGTTTTTFPITAPGTTVVTWNFNDGNGQSINVNQNVIIETTTWNGAVWSNGTPNATKHLIVTGNYTPVEDIAACSLTVNNNAVVQVNSGINFNIAGDVSVATGSSLTFESNANLVQTKNTNGNTGNITVKRKTTPLMLLDYVIWSAPVAGQQLQSFSPATLAARFLTYNPTTNQYNAVPTPSAVNFSTGTGYLIRMPNNHPTTPTIWEGQFQGVPNNGDYNLAVANNTYNAIGNPYPSTLNANTFITVNNITEALYFWRKTNNAATTSYATYTTAGGTANAGGLSLAVPNGTIQVGQGFIAKSTSTTIAFTNAMRSANNGNQFFKSKEIERNRIWLNLSKETVSVNQMMIAYMTGATAGVDAAIDGKYFNDNKIALTSNLNNEEYVIQGRGLPFDTADTVALAFKTNASGNFTIAIDAVDGLFTNNQNIFLKDKTTNTLHDLKKEAYTFTSETGTFNDRFEIVFKNTASLGVETPESIANAIMVYKQNGALHIEAGKTILKNVRLYDLRGRQLYEQKNLNATTTSIKDFAAAKQTVLIQITTTENKVITKKVLY